MLISYHPSRANSQSANPLASNSVVDIDSSTTSSSSNANNTQSANKPTYASILAQVDQANPLMTGSIYSHQNGTNNRIMTALISQQQQHQQQRKFSEPPSSSFMNSSVISEIGEQQPPIAADLSINLDDSKLQLLAAATNAQLYGSQIIASNLQPVCSHFF